MGELVKTRWVKEVLQSWVCVYRLRQAARMKQPPKLMDEAVLKEQM